MTPSTSRMEPTFVGYIGSTKDALLVIQGVLNNQLQAVPRRPHDRERSDLIKSGSVFVFIEEKSGIKRWTDGVAWSPSRILGRFLVYRELDRHALQNSKSDSGKSSGQQKGLNDKKLLGKAKKNIDDSGRHSVSSADGSFSFNDSSRSSSLNGPSVSSTSPATNDINSTVSNRSLVGSLIASYAFKDDGLIKKTLSLTIQRHQSEITSDPFVRSPGTPETYHLISYYSAEDVMSGKLIRPVDSLKLRAVQLSNDVCNAVKENSLGGKIPIEDESYYSTDESNPNAVALGFNPGTYPSQFQHLRSQSQSTISSQALATPQQQQSQTQIVSPQQHQINSGFVYGSQAGNPFPQYPQSTSQQLSSQQQFQQTPPSIPQQQFPPQPPYQLQNRMSLPVQFHQQSSSYPLPLPHTPNNGLNQSAEFLGEFNSPVSYQQQQQQQVPVDQHQQPQNQHYQHQHQRPHQQKQQKQQLQQQNQPQIQQLHLPQHLQAQQQQQQLRFYQNQGFPSASSIPSGSYPYMAPPPPQQQPQQQNNPAHGQQHQPSQEQQHHDQTFSVPPTGAPFNQIKVESPSSPSRGSIGESPLTVHTGGSFSSQAAYNLSSVTPRDNKPIISQGSAEIPHSIPSNDGIVHPSPGVPGGLANQAVGVAQNLPGPFPMNVAGNTNRWYYDENGHLGSFAGNYSQFNPQNT